MYWRYTRGGPSGIQKEKETKRGVFCIEKAYDHLNWNFLIQVMEKIGFGGKWLNWIRWCISMATFSVLVNGPSSSFFRSSRGWRL